MNSLKKIAALVGLLSLACAAHAATPPVSTAGVVSYFEIGTSTPSATPLWLATGSGNFTVYFESGTAGDYAAFFDSATAGGSYTADDDGTATAPRLATLYFTTAKTPVAMVGGARHFTNGLKAVTKGTVDKLIVRIEK